jgi:hypothetical protein
MVQRRNLFQDSIFPKSYLSQIRGSSWHKNEIKMIRRGHLDLESGEFYVQNVCREIPYNFVVEEFSV